MHKMKNIPFSSKETMCTSSLQRAFLLLCLFAATVSLAQIPAGYYAAAENKSGYALRVAMHNIIKNHTTLSYNNLWNAFTTTDKRPDNGKVWDMYSDRPSGTPAYYFTFGSDQCGSYSGEGDCYNREHSVPKSWFGGSVAPMYTDLFHLIPTDGYVNSKRSNLPFGKVTNATWTSTNGSKVGTSNISGYSGQVFEPIDDFKGDFARAYFYMAVCYMDKNLGVETQSNFSGGNLKPWAKQLLLQWAAQDPVSQKEISRNNAVYQLQHNRNPFIDFPDLAEKIFREELARLRTDYVDYYLMHMFTDPAQWNRLREMGIENWIREKKESGAIRNIGFSYHGNTERFLEILNAYDWDFCQIQYNYLDEHTQAGAAGLHAAAERGIPVIIMEPLRGGKLVNFLPREAQKLFAESGRNWSPASWAFRWLYDQPEVTVVLSGMNSLEMVAENVATAGEARPGGRAQGRRACPADQGSGSGAAEDFPQEESRNISRNIFSMIAMVFLYLIGS